jgi:hypothetical protein
VATRDKRGRAPAPRDDNDNPRNGSIYTYPRDIHVGEPDDEFKLGAAWKSSPAACRKDYTWRYGLLAWRTRRQTMHSVRAKSKAEVLECEALCAAKLEAAGAFRTGTNLGRRETWKGIPYKKAKGIISQVVHGWNKERRNGS